MVLAVILASFCGCRSIDSPDNLEGHYELKSKGLTISLDVRHDHTYTERVKYAKGSEEVSENAWLWVTTGIEFHDVLLPPVNGVRPEDFFGPETVSRLHSHRTAQETYQPDWSFAVETVFGDMRLAPYPDEEVFFSQTAQF